MIVPSLLISLPIFAMSTEGCWRCLVAFQRLCEATQNSDLLCSKCFQLRRHNDSGSSRNYDCFAPWPNNCLVIGLVSQEAAGPVTPQFHGWESGDKGSYIEVFQNSLVCLVHQCLCQASRSLQCCVIRPCPTSIDH